MTLDKYVSEELRRRKKDGEVTFKTNILKELSASSGVSLLTLQNVERGGKIQNYRKAKAISEATKGKVKVSELCE